MSEKFDVLAVAAGPPDRPAVEGGEEPVLGVLAPGRDLSGHGWEHPRALVGDPVAGQGRDLVDEPLSILGGAVGQPLACGVGGICSSRRARSSAGPRTQWHDRTGRTDPVTYRVAG